MSYTRVLKWALLYRGIASVAFVLGLAFAGAGIAVGFGGAVTAVVTDPTNAGGALDQASPLLALAFVTLGVVVWQLGKAFALFATIPRASGRRAAKSFDTTRVRSDVLEALDDRLSDMEADVQETRRSVEELKRDDHATAFDETAITDSRDPDAPTLESTGERDAGDDGNTDSVPLETGSEAGADADAEREQETGFETRSETGSGTGPDRNDGTDAESKTATWDEGS